MDVPPAFHEHPPADGSRGRTWLGDNEALVRRQQEELPAGVQVQAGQAFLLAQLGEDADGPATAAILPGTAHRPVRILRSLCSLGNSEQEQRLGSGLSTGAASLQLHPLPGQHLLGPAELPQGRCSEPEPAAPGAPGASSPLRSQLCLLPRLLQTKNLLPNSVSCPPHETH